MRFVVGYRFLFLHIRNFCRQKICLTAKLAKPKQHEGIKMYRQILLKSMTGREVFEWIHLYAC